MQRPNNRESEANLKDVGVIINERLKFKEPTDKMLLSSKVVSCMIMRTFITRDRKLMMKILNVYFRSTVK